MSFWSEAIESLMEKEYFVYIMSSKNNTVPYTGITSNLVKRIYEHKNKMVKGFTERYNSSKLVYYEVYQTPQTAMGREKTIKNLLRKKKNALIQS